FSDKTLFGGVNDLMQLQHSSELLRDRAVARAREQGVRFIAPKQTYIDDTVQIGAGSVIYPNCVLEGKTVIGENCLLEAGVVIKDTMIKENVKVLAYSYLESAQLASGCSIG